MTAPGEQRPPDAPRPPWRLLIVALVFIAIAAAASSGISAVGRTFFPSGTKVSQAVVVEKIERVAKLVSSEMTVRDVVLYENTRLGSTKRALVVVTGKVLAGIDLDRGTGVDIDESENRIEISLPRPTILAIDITELNTYDEQSGLWNRMRTSDRDSIFMIARRQIAQSGIGAGLTEHAERSARELLVALVNVPGYTTEVSFGRKPSGPVIRRPE